MQVVGDGFSSMISWAFDGHLFSISPAPNTQAADMTFKDLRFGLLFLIPLIPPHSTSISTSTSSPSLYLSLSIFLTDKQTALH